MSLRHALLAILDARPMTGYELAKQFDVSAAHVWHARHPQIYTELRRLETEGLVESEEAPRGEGATKRPYSLTDAGCEELLRWLTVIEEPARERDAALLKATYLEYGSFDLARRHLQAHRDHHRRQETHWARHADDLERRDTTLLRSRLAHTPPHAHDAVVAYKVHVYRGLTDRCRGEVRWAEEGLALVDRLEREAGLGPDDSVCRPSPIRHHPTAS